MFEQLFRYPGVVERYRAAPLARDRLRYLVHLAGAGAHPTTLRALASRQLALVRLLDVREALWGVVSRRLWRLGIDAPKRGPHALRHACAQHLLDRGLSMKAVGDHLGHRSPASMVVYARVHLAALREVVDFELEGLA